MGKLFYDLQFGKKSKTKLNLSSIKNILIIRYDITKNPTKKLAVVKDFEKSLIDQGSHMSEKLLTNSFKKISGFEKFSISLSGGIDSSLCLALLRKNFPNGEEATLLGSIKKMKLCNFNHQIDLKTGLREMVGESIADR